MTEASAAVEYPGIAGYDRFRPLFSTGGLLWKKTLS
jgi:hypothetical protein